MIKRFLSLSILFCAFQSSVEASELDTSLTIYDSRSVRYVYQKNTHSDTLVFNPLDTNSLWFQNYNPIQADNKPRLYLGNLGTANKLLITEGNNEIGFIYGRNAYDIYLKKVEDVRFYRVFSPYTNFNYFWNRRKEQLFNFSFAQNFGPRFNYAINYNRIVSVGDYDRQKTDHLTYDISLWYTSRNRRYQAYATYLNNSLIIEESGGIKSDSIFYKSSGISSEFEPVRLNNATNRIKDKRYFLKQAFAFGPEEQITLDSLSYKRIVPKFRVYHELRIQQRDDTYKESPIDAGVYADIFLDSTNTNDQIKFNHIQNRVGFEMYFSSLHKQRNSYAALYARYDFIDYENLSFQRDMKYVSLNLESKYQLTQKIEADVKANKILAGDFSDNYNAALAFNYHYKNNANYLQLSFQTIRSEASFFASNYFSNHFIRTKYLNDEQEQSVGLKFHQQKQGFEIGFKYIDQKNIMYFDSNIVAQQVNSNQYTQLYVSKTFKMGNFYLANTVYVQQNSKENIIRMPLLHTYQSLYYQHYLFKKAVYLRTGIDVRYYTKMQSLQYDPANAVFYNSNTFRTGDFPVLDYFLSLSLKRAIILLKVDHVNQGLVRAGNNMIMGYPLPDRALKIGIRWAFYD